MTRITRRSHFAAIPNEAMRDETISIEARGLLALMMGMGTNWVYRGKDLMKRCGVGREKYQRMIRELKDAGYLEVVPKRGEGGRMDGYDYVLHDTTESLKTRPPVASPAVESDHIRIPTSKNTNLKTPKPPEGDDLFSEMEEQKTEGDPFEEWWNLYPKNDRKAAKAKCREKFWATVKGKRKDVEGKVTPEDLIAALRSFVATNPDIKFVPAPMVWLNQCRWEAFTGQVEAYREEDLSPSTRRFLESGKVPPSLQNPDGSPNAKARYWLTAYGYGEAAE